MSDESKKHELHTQLLTRIVDQVQETQECVNKLDKKLDLNIQKVEFEIREINKLDEQQNASLAEHIEGVKTLKQMHSEMQTHFDERLGKLEKPSGVSRWVKDTRKGILWLGAIGGSIYGIIKALQALNIM